MGVNEKFISSNYLNQSDVKDFIYYIITLYTNLRSTFYKSNLKFKPISSFDILNLAFVEEIPFSPKERLFYRKFYWVVVN